MQLRLERHSLAVTQGLHDRLGPILAVYQSIRHIDAPMPKRPVQRLQPFTDPRFAGIDLLPTPDEADDYSPVVMPIKTRDQELGFGLRELRPPSLAPHEVLRLPQVPRPL